MDGKSLRLGLVVIVALCFLAFPTTEARQTKPSYCDSSASYSVKVDSVDIDPYPVISGKSATFKVSGIADKVIEGGKLEILVYYLGIHIHTESHDLCSKTSCPIQRGSFVLTHSQSLPGITPAGSYKLKMKMIDSDDKLLTCIDMKFRIAHDTVDVAVQ
eukprot:TRINITY_DN2302_c0_g1_i1.p1 TRINITY_DN2302_c0_g1~~TRINITY_DN2302_c0_g1_i1.p1  ORF type:complete len:159 (+),score=25.03 TRINITY_DN2302_c0_g1_i1:192-668(+)